MLTSVDKIKLIDELIYLDREATIATYLNEIIDLENELLLIKQKS